MVTMYGNTKWRLEEAPMKKMGLAIGVTQLLGAFSSIFRIQRELVPCFDLVQFEYSIDERIVGEDGPSYL